MLMNVIQTKCPCGLYQDASSLRMFSAAQATRFFHACAGTRSRARRAPRACRRSWSTRPATSASMCRWPTPASRTARSSAPMCRRAPPASSAACRIGADLGLVTDVSTAVLGLALVAQTCTQLPNWQYPFPWYLSRVRLLPFFHFCCVRCLKHAVINLTYVREFHCMFAMTCPTAVVLSCITCIVSLSKALKRRRVRCLRLGLQARGPELRVQGDAV